MTLRAGRVAVQQRDAHLAQMRAGQGDQPIRPLAQPLLANLGTTAILVLQIGTGEQVAQAQITRMGLAQQQQTERLLARRIVADKHIATDDGFDACSARFLVELHQPEHVGQVSERQRGHRICLRRAHCLADAHDAVGDGIFAMQTKVNEGGLRHDRRQ